MPAPTPAPMSMMQESEIVIQYVACGTSSTSSSAAHAAKWRNVSGDDKQWTGDLCIHLPDPCGACGLFTHGSHRKRGRGAPLTRLIRGPPPVRRSIVLRITQLVGLLT